MSSTKTVAGGSANAGCAAASNNPKTARRTLAIMARILEHK
jgi:hypothetical protein